MISEAARACNRTTCAALSSFVTQFYHARSAGFAASKTGAGTATASASACSCGACDSTWCGCRTTKKCSLASTAQAATTTTAGTTATGVVIAI